MRRRFNSQALRRLYRRKLSARLAALARHTASIHAGLVASVNRNRGLGAAVAVIWGALIVTVAVDSATYSPPAALARPDSWPPWSDEPDELRGDRELTPSETDLGSLIAPCDEARRLVGFNMFTRDDPTVEAGQAKPPSEESPSYLPGLTAVAIEPATHELVRAALGEPCPGATLWALAPADYDSPADVTDIGILFVADGFLLSLPDGRAALIAPAAGSETGSHLHLYVAAVLRDGRPLGRPVLMSGVGWLSDGDLSIPEQQPGHAFHVWQEGGPDHDRWIGVTDFSSASPAPLGFFPARGDLRCQDNDCEERSYRLTSIRYADAGPGRLTLKWQVVLYQTERECALPESCDRQEVGRRIYVANYLLSEGHYALLSGQEPSRE